MIDIPADQYLHRDAPTEWWWHTGTLTAGDRTFGFEINAASFEGNLGIGFTQIMLTDVSSKTHYQRTTPFVPPLLFEGSLWAEFDPTRDWYVKLGTTVNCLSAIAVTSPGSGYTKPPKVEITGGNGWGAGAIAVLGTGDYAGTVAEIALISPGIGYTTEPAVTLTSVDGGSGAAAQAIHTYVTMSAPWGETLKNMKVNALLNDQETGTEVTFDLTLSQQGPPFIVWGTGFQPVPGKTGSHLQTNNYYYSLTRLHASGTIAFGGETFNVTGVTWMDHEYGAFGSGAGPKWILQDMQLDNGVCISNSVSLESGNIAANQTQLSHATVQFADGTTWVVDSTVTPYGATWTSPDSGKTYYLTLLVIIPQFNATLTVVSLVDGQEFPVPGNPVYEGVASVSGTFQGVNVSGTAWNEQALRSELIGDRPRFPSQLFVYRYTIRSAIQAG